MSNNNNNNNNTTPSSLDYRDLTSDDNIKRLDPIHGIDVVKNEATGCHNTVGPTTQNGYKVVCRSRNGKRVSLYAHRIAWEYANNQKVPEGMVVMHKCDNPRCCNPDHLTIGTPAENVKDAILKGRWKSSLTVPQIMEYVASESKTLATRRVLAKKFGVTPTYLKSFLNSKTYRIFLEEYKQHGNLQSAV